jgi:hypothetical protein
MSEVVRWPVATDESPDYGLRSAIFTIEAYCGSVETYGILCRASEFLKEKIESGNAKSPKALFSNTPVIIIKKSGSEYFWEKVNKSGDCWEWTAARNKFGYGLFGVTGSRKMIVAHRWSYIEENGPIPKGMCVCHRCDNPSCVRPDHLFLGTRADNNRDKKSKGREARLSGESNGNAKLTREQVKDIRLRYNNGESTSLLGEEFSMSRQAINNVVSGKTYKSIGCDDPIPQRQIRGKILTYKDETMTLSRWAEKIGITTASMYCRLKKMPFEKAMSMPKHKEKSHAKEDQDR